MPNRVIHTRLASLPSESVANGALIRTAVRGDNSLVTINWLYPGHGEPPPPHSHPFDQLSFVLQGTMEFEVSGEQYTVATGEVLQIPANAPHTAKVVGDEVALNIDVFAPAREDLLYLAAHQQEAFQ